MNLSSDRLFLGELTWGDLDNIHALHSYPEVDEFNTIGIPKSKEDTRRAMIPGTFERNVDLITELP